uniref:Uncharacterized protein n=1 Tax=Chromera velia CCMP2878 TaxID=1169474 RepID=A0A0G4GYQ0_9ALVE|eukprot:Cvel_5415.t1-p1 / transcript=Cvel_5415.t1 / gene=Cvel_5415 / organism=Chromera_velia_CCMP2878 / gene_product=hypothetical protein / transcript_product=hypothetical protein / location=Cvel_scaffold252:27506-31159(-) / protein_length=562 / sequence_SO=supercontig / SO=protein_coding / is_pseudo=false
MWLSPMMLPLVLLLTLTSRVQIGVASLLSECLSRQAQRTGYPLDVSATDMESFVKHVESSDTLMELFVRACKALESSALRGTGEQRGQPQSGEETAQTQRRRMTSDVGASVPLYPTVEDVKAFMSLSSSAASEGNDVLPLQFGTSNFQPDGVSVGQTEFTGPIAECLNRTIGGAAGSTVSSAFSQVAGFVDAALAFLENPEIVIDLGNFDLFNEELGPCVQLERILFRKDGVFSAANREFPLGNLTIRLESDIATFLNFTALATRAESVPGIGDFLSKALRLDVDLPGYYKAAEETVFALVGLQVGSGFDRLFPPGVSAEDQGGLNDTDLIDRRCNLEQEALDERALFAANLLLDAVDVACEVTPTLPGIQIDPICLILKPLPRLTQELALLHRSQCEFVRVETQLAEARALSVNFQKIVSAVNDASREITAEHEETRRILGTSIPSGDDSDGSSGKGKGGKPEGELQAEIEAFEEEIRADTLEFDELYRGLNDHIQLLSESAYATRRLLITPPEERPGWSDSEKNCGQPVALTERCPPPPSTKETASKCAREGLCKPAGGA